STEPSPEHSYTTLGSYAVTLTVTNAVGVDSITEVGAILVDVIPPVVNFAPSVTGGLSPLSVQFADLSGVGAPTSWLWDFGDGGSSLLQHPTYVYNASGVYTVSLFASNLYGSDSFSSTNLVAVDFIPPVASFSGTPTSAPSPFVVNFTDESTGGIADAWLWTFGDGGISTSRNPSHTYAVAGSYSVQLTASNACGSDTVWGINSIDVLSGPEVLANFSGTPTTGAAPFQEDFTDLSIGNISAWDWDFGDGGDSTLQNPSYVFTTPGEYDISLSVENSGGKDDQLELKASVTVQEGSMRASSLPSWGPCPSATEARRWSPHRAAHGLAFLAAGRPQDLAPGRRQKPVRLQDRLAGMAYLFDADTDRFRHAASAALEGARAAVQAVKDLPPSASFTEVLSAFDGINRPLNGTASLVHLFFQVHPQGEMRAAAAEIEQELSRFGTEVSLDREVYDRLAGLSLEDAPDDVARRVVEHALRDFRRAGVDRDEQSRRQVAVLREQITELGQTFARNISGDVRSVPLESVAELDGLPEDFIAAHPADADGSLVLTTNPTDYLPVLKFAHSRDLRRRMHREFSRRATPDNLEVLNDLLGRRFALAQLLGYDSWADYATEDKMIRTVDRAAEFIDQVCALTDSRAEQELAQYTSCLVSLEGDGVQLRDYDRLYLTEVLRRDELDFDSRVVRPYLSYDRVLAGVLKTIEGLYGVTIQRREDLALWHEDVAAYDLLQEGKVTARFFLDMHSRDDKFKHAAMFDLSSGLSDGTLAQACLVCNLPRPSDGDAALLDPSEVTTLFHEFGHLLHHLLANNQEWFAVSGISTEWDFVEVPSQLFEEWGRDAAVLTSFARHHETGAVIPLELVERMNRAEGLGRGLVTRLQMFYASLSLEYYRRPPSEFDTTELMVQLKQRFVPFPHEDGTAFQASFGHLNGYNAMYYTYMWSLVLAKDCFSRFQGQLMNREVANSWRETVLARGGSRDAEQLMTDFLGRESRFDAFEAWLVG
ncbi:MAG: thimet oligopeptidase, partial [Pseudohongiellaceae bacterium]